MYYYTSGHSCRQIFVELTGFTQYVGSTSAYYIAPTTLNYIDCLAECRADHKCLSLKYTDGLDSCFLYDTVPHHIPELKKSFSDKDFTTVVLQCGKCFCFIRCTKTTKST